MIFEREFEAYRKEETQQAFLETIQAYDDYVFESMKQHGWISNGFKERTMSFTFGTLTFKRRCYFKDGKYRVPVDEHFHFPKGQRLSIELLIKIVKLALEGTYAAACRTIWELYHIDISVWSVFKAVSHSAKLLEERNLYRYMEESPKKLKVKRLYIEGDGVWMRTRHPKEEEKYWCDYAHFVIHTGVITKKKDRPECQNKMEFFGPNIEDVRQQLIDYVHNHFDVTEAIAITNSDGGHGYTPASFRSLVRELGIKKHEHFWDRYHVREAIEWMTRPFPDLGKLMLEATYKHDKKLLKTTLDTLQSKLESPNDEKFTAFKKKMLRNFKYMKTPEMRSIEGNGIGVIESNHRKITYRGKRRGMHWSKRNITAIGRLIILREAKQLDDLFYGDWRETYEKFHEIDEKGWLRVIHEGYEMPQHKF